MVLLYSKHQKFTTPNIMRWFLADNACCNTFFVAYTSVQNMEPARRDNHKLFWLNYHCGGYDQYIAPICLQKKTGKLKKVNPNAGNARPRQPVVRSL